MSSSTAHSVPPPAPSDKDIPDQNTLEQLQTDLHTDSLKKQLGAVQELVALGDAGLDVMVEVLKANAAAPPTVLDGKLLQVLSASDRSDIQATLQSHWPQGRVPLESAAGIDYGPLQTLLIDQAYEEADRLTLKKLCELAGEDAVRRKWLYFTEVEQFPATDLRTLDQLWWIYSEGKFGFSRQRELWLGLGRSWDKLWTRIAWKKDNVWTRYPNEFIWDLSAPDGHLPLSNQLRGVRVMDALLSHPAWTMDS